MTDLTLEVRSFASPHPDVEIPDQSLVAFLLDGVEINDDRIALTDAATGQEVTFGALRVLVDSFATGLSRIAAPTEVVALLAPNSTAFVVGFLGALRAGLTVSPVNVLATAEDAARQVVDAGARVVLTVGPLAEVAKRAAKEAGLADDAVLVLDESPHGVGALARFADLAPYRGEPVKRPAEHLAVLPYSSGTTGTPKGVMLTHRNLVANICQIEGLLGVEADSALLGVLPFSHIYGMTVVLNLALRRRARLVIVPRFELRAALSLIQEHRITHLFVAPPVILALAKAHEVDEYDVSSVELVLSGAAPLDDALASTVASRLDCQVRQAYGMSEMSPVSHLAPLASHPAASSVGWAVPNMTMRLVDVATGSDIAVPADGTSAPGELCCAGPNVMAGYLNNPTATADCIDERGYLHTGDLATVSADGTVTIVDRLKELIKYKGYQVAPAELEGLLLAHPEIADAAVIGVPQGESGDEWPKAFVVPTPESDLRPDDVAAYVAERVAPYKKVRLVELIDVIPKSASGKILRRELRDTPN